MSIAAGDRRERHREDRDQDQLEQTEDPDARDLAGHQVAGPDRRQQHLDDAGGLLLDHPGRDPDAVAEELPVQDEHGRERDSGLRVTVGIRRQDRRRVRRMLILKRFDGGGVRPGVLEHVLELVAIAAACTTWSRRLGNGM